MGWVLAAATLLLLALAFGAPLEGGQVLLESGESEGSRAGYGASPARSFSNVYTGGGEAGDHKRYMTVQDGEVDGKRVEGSFAGKRQPDDCLQLCIKSTRCKGVVILAGNQCNLVDQLRTVDTLVMGRSWMKKRPKDDGGIRKHVTGGVLGSKALQQRNVDEENRDKLRAAHDQLMTTQRLKDLKTKAAIEAGRLKEAKDGKDARKDYVATMAAAAAKEKKEREVALLEAQSETYKNKIDFTRARQTAREARTQEEIDALKENFNLQKHAIENWFSEQEGARTKEASHFTGADSDVESVIANAQLAFDTQADDIRSNAQDEKSHLQEAQRAAEEKIRRAQQE